MKEFYHASRDINFLRSFLREGAKAIGKGVGGQQNGFYVHNNKKSALEHIKFLNERKKALSPEGGLIVGVKVDEKKMKYPDWQFDYEANTEVLPLLQNYAPVVVKTLMTIQLPHLKIYSAHKTNRYGRFLIEAEKEGEIFQKAISPVDPGTTDFTETWQKVFDTLCQTPSIKKEYDTLLKSSLFSCKKYIGEKALPVSFLSYIQPTADGKYKETILYTDEKPKEQQVCPFFKVYSARVSSPSQKESAER